METVENTSSLSEKQNKESTMNEVSSSSTPSSSLADSSKISVPNISVTLDNDNHTNYDSVKNNIDNSNSNNENNVNSMGNLPKFNEKSFDTSFGGPPSSLIPSSTYTSPSGGHKFSNINNYSTTPMNPTSIPYITVKLRPEINEEEIIEILRTMNPMLSGALDRSIADRQFLLGTELMVIKLFSTLPNDTTSVTRIHLLLRQILRILL